MEGMGGQGCAAGREAMARGISPPCIHQPHSDPCRVLQLFLSRTAQRGPHLSSGRLLQHLGLLLLLVLGFLAVWTAGILEQGSQHASLVARGHTHTGRHFYLCHHDRWDYIMVVGELLPLSPASLWSPSLYLQGSSCLVPGPLDRGPPSTAYRERGAWLLRWYPALLISPQLRCCPCAGAASSATPPGLFPQPCMSRGTWASPCIMSCCFLLPSTQPGEDGPAYPPRLPPNNTPHLSQVRVPPPHSPPRNTDYASARRRRAPTCSSLPTPQIPFL